MILTLTECFILCWIGNQLKENVNFLTSNQRYSKKIKNSFKYFQSLKIADCVASCDLLNLDRKHQKDALLIIRMAQRPRKLSAIFFTLEWETFTVVRGKN